MNITRSARRALCAATIAAGVLAGSFAGAGQARAATSVSGPYSQDSATCRAFAAIERKVTARRFAVMVRDSRSALWFLRLDVEGWQLDVRDRAPGWVLGMDAGLVRQDCADPAAEEFG